MNAAYVHYGVSTSAVESWLNFDASPTVWVQNLPVVGKSLAKLAGNGFSSPSCLKYGDIAKGLPVPDGVSRSIKGITRQVRLALGHSRHHWMWDYPAMRDAMEKAGFVDVRRCDLGDADDPMFADVERADRYNTRGIPEVGVQGRKPG